jgi:hypothetical protein
MQPASDPKSTTARTAFASLFAFAIFSSPFQLYRRTYRQKSLIDAKSAEGAKDKKARAGELGPSREVTIFLISSSGHSGNRDSDIRRGCGI